MRKLFIKISNFFYDMFSGIDPDEPFIIKMVNYDKYVGSDDDEKEVLDNEKD